MLWSNAARCWCANVGAGSRVAATYCAKTRGPLHRAFSGYALTMRIITWVQTNENCWPDEFEQIGKIREFHDADIGTVSAGVMDHNSY